MLTGDGIEVDWPYSAIKIASFITAAHIQRLKSDDCAIVADALAELKRAQVHLLYRDSKLALAKQRYQLGRRIKQTSCLDYCLGSYDQKLWRIFGKFPARQYEKTWQRNELIKALMKGT